MTTSGPNSPGTIADDASVGTEVWSNPDNAKVSDNVYASTPGAGYLYDSAVKIVKSDGSIGLTNKASVIAWTDTLGYFSYGGASDLWGETWSPSDINDADFGVVLQTKVSDDGDHWSYSHYLKATNFGFAIPDGAIIDGITVEVQRYYYSSGGGGTTFLRVDHIRITITYTPETSYNTRVGTKNSWTIDKCDYSASEKCPVGTKNAWDWAAPVYGGADKTPQGTKNSWDWGSE